MNPNIVFGVKAFGILLAYGAWVGLVWHGNTPADGFVAGLLSLIGFLTGNAVGKSTFQEESKHADAKPVETPPQSGNS